MGVIEEVKAALADTVRLNSELRKELVLARERAADLNTAYDMLRDDVVVELEKQNERYAMLLRAAFDIYAWRTESCVFDHCSCGFDKWRAAVKREFNMTDSEELPFSEPPHD